MEIRIKLKIIMITQLSPTNLIAVEVPINSGFFMKDKNPNVINYDPDVNTEEGGWEFINLSFKFNVLGEVTKDKIGFDVKPYSDKYNTGFYREHKEKSFYYLLAANGLYFENPEGELYPYRFAESDGTLQTLDWHRNKWKEFEDKLIKGKLLILEKL
jgi:hypothetical protein